MKKFDRNLILWAIVLCISFVASVVAFVHLFQDATISLADKLLLSMLVFVCSCSIGEYLLRHIEK